MVKHAQHEGQGRRAGTNPRAQHTHMWKSGREWPGRQPRARVHAVCVSQYERCPEQDSEVRRVCPARSTQRSLHGMYIIERSHVMFGACHSDASRCVEVIRKGSASKRAEDPNKHTDVCGMQRSRAWCGTPS